METWNHPVLGEFSLSVEEEAWCKYFKLPAFETYGRQSEPREPRDQVESDLRFMFEAMAENSGPLPPSQSKGFPVYFAIDEPVEPPSSKRIKLAEHIVENSDSLVAKINQAFFDSFLGIGDNCGMYWHGAGAQIAGCIGQSQLNSPSDLELLLRSPSAYISCLGECTIDFSCVFEEEHGVSVLTNGIDVLGLGYLRDVLPFGEI